MTIEANRQDQTRQHRKVALRCGVMTVSMLGAAYAAVPLYQMFCQVTGFGGTTKKAERPAAVILERMVNVRFDSNVGAGLKWSFVPVERPVDVKLGESTLIHYRATNTSDKPSTGTATFNVTPEIAGAYFNKLECFCFKEQTLQPGESIDMPVLFFVDPAMVDHKQAAKVGHITLSYTFYPVDKPAIEKQAKADMPGGGARQQ